MTSDSRPASSTVVPVNTVIAATMSSFAWLRATEGVPALSVLAAGSRYGRDGSSADGAG